MFKRFKRGMKNYNQEIINSDIYFLSIVLFVFYLLTLVIYFVVGIIYFSCLITNSGHDWFNGSINVMIYILTTLYLSAIFTMGNEHKLRGYVFFVNLFLLLLCQLSLSNTILFMISVLVSIFNFMYFFVYSTEFLRSRLLIDFMGGSQLTEQSYGYWDDWYDSGHPVFRNHESLECVEGYINKYGFYKTYKQIKKDENISKLLIFYKKNIRKQENLRKKETYNKLAKDFNKGLSTLSFENVKPKLLDDVYIISPKEIHNIIKESKRNKQEIKSKKMAVIIKDTDKTMLSQYKELMGEEDEE